MSCGGCGGGAPVKVVRSSKIASVSIIRTSKHTEDKPKAIDVIKRSGSVRSGRNNVMR